MAYDLPENLDLELINVETSGDKNIIAEFTNGGKRVFNIENMFDERPEFKTLLIDKNMFKNIYFDKYSIYFGDELDISECQIWFEGDVVPTTYQKF